MQIRNIIARAAAWAVVALLFQWIFKAQGRKAIQRNGSAVVSYSVPLKACHALGVMLLLILAIAAAWSGEKMYVMSFGTMAFVGFCCSWELYSKRIEFDDREFVIYLAWCKPKRIPWTDVISFKNESSLDWTVRTRSHGKITFFAFLSGLQDLRAAAEKNVRKDSSLVVPLPASGGHSQSLQP
jgi:hypothetical protein